MFQTKLRLFYRSHQRMWPNSRLLFVVSTAELFSESGSIVFMNGYRGGVAKNKATAVGIERPSFCGNLFRVHCGSGPLFVWTTFHPRKCVSSLSLPVGLRSPKGGSFLARRSEELNPCACASLAAGRVDLSRDRCCLRPLPPDRVEAQCALGKKQISRES